MPNPGIFLELKLREVSSGRTRNNAISSLFIELKLREVSVGVGRTRNNGSSSIFFEL